MPLMVRKSSFSPVPFVALSTGVNRHFACFIVNSDVKEEAWRCQSPLIGDPPQIRSVDFVVRAGRLEIGQIHPSLSRGFVSKTDHVAGREPRSRISGKEEVCTRRKRDDPYRQRSPWKAHVTALNCVLLTRGKYSALQLNCRASILSSFI
jgi:hypothetical protein